jgi:hypothetical protein
MGSSQGSQLCPPIRPGLIENVLDMAFHSTMRNAKTARNLFGGLPVNDEPENFAFTFT